MDEIENLNWAQDYAERGYTAGVRGVLLADWNYFPSDIDRVLSSAGFDVQWNDEWDTCEQCGKLVRTSGDCYDWQPHYVIEGECSLVCLDCVDWESYLEGCEDNPGIAVMRECDPSDYGYELLSSPGEYESGWHPGQTDTPQKVLAGLQERGYKRIVFRIPETSQFYMKFETWQKVQTEDIGDDTHLHTV